MFCYLLSGEIQLGPSLSGNNSKADPVNDDIPILIHNSKNDMNDEAIERFVYPASFFSQFTVLLKRTLQTIWRDRVGLLYIFKHPNSIH